jgi:ubiquitin carboxyl-terminal hydrolase L5
MAGWCTIESDPAVFTEMMERFGVSGIAVEELLSCDVDSLKQLPHTYGLVLLFKYKAKETRQVNLQHDSTLYFARQTVNNACATQAIVNLLLNHPESIQLGEKLNNFLEFTQPLDPQTRGDLIGQSDFLREVHNGFAQTHVFSFENRRAREDDDAYHFVTFTFKHGAIWELDGLQPAPILCADANEADWMEKMVVTVQQRIEQIAALDLTGHGQGISFSLMAVTDDRITILEKEIALLESQEKPTAALEAELAEVKERRERGKVENIRRRHNYIPLVVELLRALAEQGKLEAIYEEAKAKATARSPTTDAQPK